MGEAKAEAGVFSSKGKRDDRSVLGEINRSKAPAGEESKTRNQRGQWGFKSWKSGIRGHTGGFGTG